MITSNNAEEIIEFCNTKAEPAGFLEIYVWFLCQQLEYRDERIKWLSEQLKKA